MRMLRLVMTIAGLLLIAWPALAGTYSDVSYRLYYLSPNGQVPVLSVHPLPAGSNVAPNNVWRYDYVVLNKSTNALNTFYAYFNSDNSTDAQYTSGTAPTNWVLTKLGPATGYNNYKVRVRTTVTASMIPTGGTLSCSMTFTWTGSTVPGPQNYDAVNSGGSESGVTAEDTATPVQASTWGRIKALYR